VQGTCAFGTGCRGARLLVWLILNDRVQPSFIAGVGVCSMPGGGGANMPDALPVHPPMGAMGAMGGGGLQPPPSLGLQPPPSLQMMGR
jgi:hypothetical protein